MKLHTFPSREELIKELVSIIAEYLTQGIDENGSASMAVSGGTTPVDLFKNLSTLPIQWEKIFITLVDERWVEPTDADSNEKLVRTHLLQNNAASANFSGMKNEAETAGEGARECERLIKKLPLPFDVLLLGLGGDGHTASIFPGTENLAAATDMQSDRVCMGIVPLTAPHERMTLTLPAILSARQIILHITGQHKKEVLDLARQHGPLEELPIRFILKQNSTPFSVYWAE